MDFTSLVNSSFSNDFPLEFDQPPSNGQSLVSLDRLSPNGSTFLFLKSTCYVWYLIYTFHPLFLTNCKSLLCCDEDLFCLFSSFGHSTSSSLNCMKLLILFPTNAIESSPEPMKYKLAKSEVMSRVKSELE